MDCDVTIPKLNETIGIEDEECYLDCLHVWRYNGADKVLDAYLDEYALRNGRQSIYR